MVNDRLKYNLFAVVAAFFLFGLICAYAISKSASTDIAALVGSLTTAVGTIVGAYIGANIGAEGKQEAITEQKEAVKELKTEIEKRNKAERMAQGLIAAADADTRNNYPEELQKSIKTFSEDIT